MEVTIKVLDVGMKARVLRQIPHVSESAELDAFVPVCWFQSSTIERDRVGRSVLGTVVGAPVVVFQATQWHRDRCHVEEHKLFWGNQFVPFAVVR